MRMVLLCLSVVFLVEPCFAAGVTNSAHDPPNILWITSEDNSARWLGCYGNSLARTPHIDRLAREGFLFENCFANVPVCAPCRSSWITGIHAVSNGSLPMRSRYNVIPHEKVRYYPDYLKAAGYRCYNPGKTDYNIGGRDDTDCWEASEKFAWKIDDQRPFFQVVNIGFTHESSLHGMVSGDPVPDGSLARKVQIARHHPDLPEMRYNYAEYLDRVSVMDYQVGKVLEDLAAAGQAEKTIVIYNSDHGGVLPRSKRFLLDTGLHCPL
ncbi:MAG: sulfatase-like hydrolase/transferase, partial [Planctomycetales bacterium]